MGFPTARIHSQLDNGEKDPAHKQIGRGLALGKREQFGRVRGIVGGQDKVPSN